ncbi:acyl-CoA synthetase [Rhodovulum sp. DZ06]|uniref:acyl-CoA synthetase n=1 Tax=Rhodovulum sp. DZ06 TaxID=3425126 RepID=UPI003D335125
MSDDETLRRPRSQQIGDLLRRSAARTPDRVALAFRDRRDTYAELDEAVNRAANGFRAAGIGRGDRVALLSRNSRTFVVLRFALARIGAVMVPVNFMLNAADLAYIFGHSGATTLCVEDALCAVADEAVAQMDGAAPQRFFLPHEGVDPGPGWTSIDTVLSHPDTTEPWVEVGPEDPCQMMYTSGTESRPKGAMLTASALYANYVSTIIDGEMGPDAVELHCLPLFHCAQLDCFLTPSLYLGAVNILHDRADPAAMLETIEREGVTKLFCPPTVWIGLLRHPDFDKRDLSSLKQGYYGASIMPTAVIEELSRRLPGIRLWNFYGQTEMAPLATILRPEEQLTKLGSAGRPAINVETRVVDDEDRPVPVGEVGEIVHRSPHLILGYHDQPEKTAESFKNGWFHSGDLGRFDEDGYLYVVDRKKDMIKTGGENVASREVEEAIFHHPAVAEVAVFGAPHPRWIEAITAVVVAKDGESPSPEELRAWCRERLAHFKAPQHVEVVEALPKNASGKVLKRDLRERFLGLFEDASAVG